MLRLLPAYLEEWARGDGKESYFDIFLTIGEVRHNREHNRLRSERGKALRVHFFGSQQAPSSSVVRAAIQAEGSAAALASKLSPIIKAGFNSPLGALTAALQSHRHSSKNKPSTVQIRFSDWYTFMPVPGLVTLWSAPDRFNKGAYLWCVEYENSLLVNYVGKTWDAGGFNRRIGQEFEEYKQGRYCTPVNVDEFKRCRRIELGCSMSREQLEKEFREIVPLYRLLLVRLNSDAEARLVESSVVHMLCQDSATSQFLCNKSKHSYVKRVDLDFASDSPRIVGLTAPIPGSLRKLLSENE